MIYISNLEYIELNIYDTSGATRTTFSRAAQEPSAPKGEGGEGPRLERPVSWGRFGS